MRDYGKVHTSFWSSDDIHNLSDDAKLLAIYLLTGQHTNMIGCFRLPDGYVTEDLNWSPERVSKGFNELSKNGFATRDFSSKLVFIHNFLSWNTLDNPNQGVSAIRLFEKIPDKSPLKPLLARVLSISISHLDHKKLKGLERVLKPFRNQEQEQEQEQKNTLSDFGSNRTDEAKTASPEKPPAPEKPEPEQSANRDVGIEPEPGTDHAGESDPPDKPDDRDKPGEPDPVDQAFGEIFWKAGLCKVGKLKACSAFRSKYRDWKKSTHGSPPEFASMLADDIRRRLSAGVFGVDKLHPATYLNQERWNDELPAASASATGGDSPVRDVSHLSEEQRRELAMYELLEGR